MHSSPHLTFDTCVFGHPKRQASSVYRLGWVAAALCAVGYAGLAQAVPTLDASNDFLPSLATAVRRMPISTCCRPTS